MRPHLLWIFKGGTTGALVQQQRRRRLQDREIPTRFQGMDETEQGFMLDAMWRAVDQSVPMQVVQATLLARIDAHRATQRAWGQ